MLIAEHSARIEEKLGKIIRYQPPECGMAQTGRPMHMINQRPHVIFEPNAETFQKFGA